VRACRASEPNSKPVEREEEPSGERFVVEGAWDNPAFALLPWTADEQYRTSQRFIMTERGRRDQPEKVSLQRASEERLRNNPSGKGAPPTCVETVLRKPSVSLTAPVLTHPRTRAGEPPPPAQPEPAADAASPTVASSG
jgi:hypothetical protein